MNDDNRFQFEKFERPMIWLHLVGRGSRWRAGVGYLPPTSASALKSGKTGVLGADGEPDISPQGRKLTDKEKAKIAKTDKEMIAKEKAERAAKKGEESEETKAVLSPVVSSGTLVDAAKSAGVKGLRKNSKESIVKTKVIQHIAARKAEKYLSAGKQSGLPQYKNLSNNDVATLASIVASSPYSVNVRAGWIFDSRGYSGDRLVKAGLMEPDNGNYKHRLTPVGKEFVQSVLQTQYRDMSQKQLMEELSALK